MAGLRIKLLVLIASAEYALSQITGNTDDIQNQCAIESRVNLTGETPDESGFVVQSGYVFPPDSVWNEDNDIVGCACYNRSKCSPLACPMGAFMYYQIHLGCEEVVLNGAEDSGSIMAPVPLIYPVDVPIGSVVMNNDSGYMHFDYGDCEWMENDTAIGDALEKGVCVRSNDSVYLPRDNISFLYNFESYCLCEGLQFEPFILKQSSRGIMYTIIQTYYVNNDTMSEGATMAAHVGMIISVPFLLITFIVYSILPEMKNIHGLTLRGYVGCLLVAYTILAVVQTVGPISDLPCLFFAFTIHFSFLASFFWLNVMCFDIWWTFGGFRSIRGKVEHGESKKFLMYLIYALGCASLVTGICMIMDFVPGIPDTLIRPEFSVESNCWFKTDEAKALFFYGPMGLTIICNIFFFVSTAVKIIRHKKSTAHHLNHKNSKKHGNDNKQWFNLYLKLFIVMGINWSLEIISWLYKDLEYVWYVTDLGNALQGLIIFVIFICKKKIMRLLVKRFGCQAPNFLSLDSTKTTNRSSNSETVMTSVSPSA